MIGTLFDGTGTQCDRVPTGPPNATPRPTNTQTAPPGNVHQGIRLQVSLSANPAEETRGTGATVPAAASSSLLAIDWLPGRNSGFATLPTDTSGCGAQPQQSRVDRCGLQTSPPAAATALHSSTREKRQRHPDQSLHGPGHSPLPAITVHKRPPGRQEATESASGPRLANPARQTVRLTRSTANP